MMKTIYVIFGTCVILIYLASAWFGWEFANAGRNSYFHMPFIFGGYRGGK